MRRLLLSILAYALTFSVLPAAAEDVLVVMSLRSSGYNEVVESARKTCTVSARHVFLNETPDLDLARVARESRAKIVLAVGDKAFQMATASLPRTPVVAVLTLESQTIGKNVKAISYLAKPDQYLALMKQINRRRVGVVYGAQMSSYIKRADKIARSYGITLEKREVQSAQDVTGALSSLVGQVDALWVLPDSSVVNQGTIEHLFNFTSATRTPAIVFSKNYLKNGAAVALEPERTSMGIQAGQHICETLDIPAQKSAAVNPGQIYSIQSNHTILNALGIPPL